MPAVPYEGLALRLRPVRGRAGRRRPDLRVDPYSETWQAVAAALDIKITLALRPLETPGTSPTETEFLRGRLSLARELLKLAEPRPEIQVASPVDY